MEDDKTWVKIHRKLIYWEWFKQPETLQLFLYLLLKANHRDGKWQGIDVKRGQLITGRKSISEATGLSEQIIRTCMNRLKSTSEITSESTNQFSLITIIKYNDYQDKEIKLTSESTSESTNEQPAINQQLTTNNNDNNVNNGKKEEIQDILNYFNATCKKSYKLNPARIKVITKRLESNTPEEIKAAILNFSKDDWKERYKFMDVVYAIGTIRGIDNFDKWFNTQPIVIDQPKTWIDTDSKTVKKWID